MDTITVVASRGTGITATETLIGSAIVIALLAWAAFSGMRSLRSRQGQPHA